jgi:hypothetical protein
MSLGINVRMAFHTGNVPVYGILDIFPVDGHGYLLSFYSLEDILFFVTGETFSIGSSEYQAFAFQPVGMMTVGAGRNGSGFLFPELALNDFDMHFFDSGMAFGAGRSDVSGRNR